MRILITCLMIGSLVGRALSAPSVAAPSSKATAKGGAKAAPLPAPICKPGAPVGVNAVFDHGVAHVVLDFGQAVEGALVRVSGTDGLAVQGQPTLGGHYDAGAVVRFDQSYTSPPGGYLVVTVEGEFAGLRQSRVTAFHLPGGAAAKQGTVTKTPSGGSVQVLPGETTIRR